MPHPSLDGLSRRFTVTGHAIVTADGMIADANGLMPPVLFCDADWRMFQAALDAAAVVVLGRLGHDRHPNPGRTRLVVTRGVDGFRIEAGPPLVALWNPAGAGLADVLEAMGIVSGTIAVTGGTGAFDLFLGRYDSFLLSEVHGAVLSGGTPCFTEGHPRSSLAHRGCCQGVRSRSMRA